MPGARRSHGSGPPAARCEAATHALTTGEDDDRASHPGTLTTRVLDAVAHGDWTPTEVTATVISEVRTDRSDVMATLWTLVEAGVLSCCDWHGQLGFRLAS